MQSASIGADDAPPILLYSDPERLLEHLGERLGIEAVLGMAEVAAWAEAPARAIGRFDVRKPPKSLDEMWAGVANEAEREAIRIAMFGSVMDVVDRFLPDPVKHAPMRSMLSFLAVNSTYRGPYSPGSALCLAFALASPGTATMSKVRGGLGTMADHLLGLFERHGGELRRHAKVTRIVVDGGAVPASSSARARWSPRPSWSPTSTRRRRSVSCSTPRRCRKGSRGASVPSTTGPPTSRRTSPSTGCPSTSPPTRSSTRPSYSRNVTFFGTAEEMQRDFEGCVRGQVPESPSFNLQIPSLDDPSLAPEGKHAASSFAFYLPDRPATATTRTACATRWPRASSPRSRGWRRTSRT